MSSFEAQAALKNIRRFVNLQRKLIIALNLSCNVNEINFRNELPSAVLLGKQKWNVKPHGVGVRFQCDSTGEVVDAHVGFIELPHAVDEWRLTVYFESTKDSRSGSDNWNEMLLALEQQGLVQRDAANNRLFVIT